MKVQIITLVFCWLSVSVTFQVAMALGPTVFVSNYLERGDASTKPLPEQQKDTISVAAAAGEYEPATISLRSGEVPLTNVTVRLSGDLRSAEGNNIPSSALQVRLAVPFGEWKNLAFAVPLNDFESEANQQCEWSLPFLVQGIDIPQDTTRRFWLTVHIPHNALPGVYQSEVVVEQSDTSESSNVKKPVTLRRLTYEVTVLPVRIASAAETGMAFFMYNDTAFYPPELRAPEYQGRVLADMREHGMTTATIYSYPKLEDGQADLEAPGEHHLSFAQWMDLLRHAEMPASGVPVIWLGAEHSPAGVWSAVLEGRLRHNWPEILFYAVDEPGDDNRNARVHVFMEKFNSFRRENVQYGARVTTAIGSPRGVNTAGQFYDLWIGCMGQETGESGLIESARTMEKQLWTYDCMLAPVDAETDRYYFGIWAWASGVRGCAHWAYYDSGPRLSYVSPTVNEIIPTIGWEAVREGIDDYRYLFTLKRLADTARAEGRADLATGADRILDDVALMVTMDNYGRAFLTTRQNDGAEVSSAYRRPRVEPDLDIHAYDQLRSKVSQEIIKLSQAIGDTNRAESSKTP